MQLGTIATFLLGAIAFWWGTRFGRLLVRKGATANDLFKGKTWVSLACLGLYVGLLLLALYVPQLQSLPLSWRYYGMEVTWVMMRLILLGFCGVTWIVSWRTARYQVFAVAMIGLVGMSGFAAAEDYLLSPIYPTLENNLRPNGVYEQTSASSCAPAAMATVLHRWGLQATESDVARLAGTSRMGTSMPQLIVAAKALGMDGIELSPTWEQMQQINRPGVLATWLFSASGKQAHATALIGLDERYAAIADPAFGKIYQVSRNQFERLWRNQYVPVYEPTAVLLANPVVADYLQRLGFLESTQDNLPNGIRRFQSAMGIPVTGELNPTTALLLSGPFLDGVPTLKEEAALFKE